MAEEAKGVEEVHILWTSEGMSCDGDSVSITAAMQPSLKEVVLGAIPGRWPNGSTTSAKPQSTCLITRFFKTTWCSSTFANRW